ncbi:riboflavin biosynthesis protein RibF [Agaricicola taiwanensis]|uniref:Riboflavin biosynthesis protein n=1 Tax=Agaricicola taiwanensis TaxID=591372 RepID=A0A8J2VNR3_9RHOB|nr:bifunctional riboflavin kinase/FAD synthetase [Agaricicola taiwanensis]GGE34323.1 riboflavin biosynthesis protein RibF [Agaricicola taiwanensis]
MTIFPSTTSFTVTHGHENDGVLKGGALAIGNFDGVHRGHKAVLAQARAMAHPSVAVTFEPHPRTLFRPDAPVPRLTSEADKLRLLKREGMDGAVILPFDRALAAVDAEHFVTEILIGRFQPQAVVVGYDFHFGKDRAGSPDFLRDAGKRHGFAVEVVAPFGEGAPISSSTIRSLLGAGEVSRANGLLGHRWFVSGEVVHGDKRGRDLGYPTANIVLPPESPLAHGIYAVRAGFGGTILGGVASFGRRPTFDDGAPRLEVFLFDFAGDLYGKTLDIEFLGHIRGEEKFDTIEALLARMDLDSKIARDMLAEPDNGDAPSAIEAFS